MSHAFLFVPNADSPSDSGIFREGVQALSRFKAVEITDTVISGVAAVAVAPDGRSTYKLVTCSADGKVWIVALGTWLPLRASNGRDAEWLVDRYLTCGAHELARRLQGFFALLIVDQRSGQTHVVTDRCGSLHVYWRRVSGGYVVCSSSAALALCDESKLDPVAVHEFVATGVIYESRSLWQDIKKIGPATVLTIDHAGARVQTYWNFAEVYVESLSLNEAVEQIHHGLVEVLKALPLGTQPLVSDLTGGYDSRFLLAGLMEAERPFHTTVSGSHRGHPDVLVAAQIAREFGLRHQHIVSKPIPLREEFDAALRMTDGEYDAFDFARILATHRILSVEHSMSLNGSFGELARGYWWELLWPKLASRQPLDVAMVARKRFAAFAYDKSVFDPIAKLDLGAHMAEVAGRAIRPVAGGPNTSQMDCVYYSLRMQRWQGRIASSTNQLWPAISPIGFSQVLDPILAVKASARFRSLLVRKLFSRFAPPLARIPLELGYPPMPATPLNVWRFTPLLGHYGGKVWSKVNARFGRGKRKFAGPNVVKGVNEAFVPDTDMAEWLNEPLLLETGIFRPERLHEFALANAIAGAPFADQWRRMVTIEGLLRKVGA